MEEVQSRASRLTSLVLRTSGFTGATGGVRRFHSEAKTWHGLARAVRRGISNMKIQAYLTAAAINLKRLAAALFALF
jgi:hypothetical protein